MRKFSLLAMLATLFCCLQANAVDLYLRGVVSWDPIAANKFTTTDDVNYVIEDITITGKSEFKIGGDTWAGENQYGGKTDMVPGTEYTLDNWDNVGNMTMKETFKGKVTFNRNTKKILFTSVGEVPEDVITYALHGEFATSDTWADVKLTESNGLWKADNVEVVPAQGVFGIRQYTNGVQTAWINAKSAVTISETTTVDLQFYGTNIKINKGVYNFSLNPETMKLDVTLVSGGGAVEEKDYIICYFDNSKSNWEEVYVYTWEPDFSGSWPGTKLTEKTAEGLYIYKITSASEPATSGKIKFNAGQGKPETGDFSYDKLGLTFDKDGVVTGGEPQEPTYTYQVRGNFNGEWNNTNMTEAEGIWTVENMEVTGERAEFGFRQMNGNVQNARIAGTENVTVTETCTINVKVDGTNITLNKGTYNISLDPANMTATITVVNTEEPPKELYLVGANYGDWKKDDAYKMTREGNVYTITLPNGLTGEWKIFSGELDAEGHWTYSFGAGANQPVANEEADAWFNSGANFTTTTTGETTIKLTVVEGSDVAGSSIPSKILITGEGAVVPPTPDYTVALVGAFNGWSETATTTTEVENNCATIVIDNWTGGEFKFKVNDTWYGKWVENGTFVAQNGVWEQDPSKGIENDNIALPESANGKKVSFTIAVDNGNFCISWVEVAAPEIVYEQMAAGAADDAPVKFTLKLAEGVEGTIYYQIAAAEASANRVQEGFQAYTAGTPLELTPGNVLSTYAEVDGKESAVVTKNYTEARSEAMASGVAAFEIENGEARFFNLQGVEVANPSEGIYIRVANGKATKVLVK